MTKKAASTAKKPAPKKGKRIAKSTGKPDRRGGPKPGSGRPPWEPVPKTIRTDDGLIRQQTQEEAWDDAKQLVRHYIAIGYPAEVICKLMDPPVCSKTLREKFAHEMENGLLIQNARVAGTGYAMAVSGRDPGMTRFWLRARMGWSEDAAAHSSGPIQVESIPGDEGL